MTSPARGFRLNWNRKKVRIDEVALLGGEGDAFRFRIRCGGGTYIRSLARDIAEKLGTKAVMSGLRRTKSGYFKIEEAVSFDALAEENIDRVDRPDGKRASLRDDRPDLPRAEKIFCGVPAPTDYADGEYKIYRDGIFYGIAEVRNKRAKIKTKLC